MVNIWIEKVLFLLWCEWMGGCDWANEREVCIMKIYTGDGGAARFFIPRGGGGGLVKLLCLLGGRGRRNIHNAARPWLASPFDVPPDLHYRWVTSLESWHDYFLTAAPCSAHTSSCEISNAITSWTKHCLTSPAPAHCQYLLFYLVFSLQNFVNNALRKYKA